MGDLFAHIYQGSIEGRIPILMAWSRKHSVEELKMRPLGMCKLYQKVIRNLEGVYEYIVVRFI